MYTIITLICFIGAICANAYRTSFVSPNMENPDYNILERGRKFNSFWRAINLILILLGMATIVIGIAATMN